MGPNLVIHTLVGWARIEARGAERRLVADPDMPWEPNEAFAAVANNFARNLT